MSRDVTAAEAVVNTVFHLLVAGDDGIMEWFYRVDEGGGELLELGHPAAVVYPGRSIRDDRCSARHLPCFIKMSRL